MKDVASKIAKLPVSGFYVYATGLSFSPNGKQIAVVAEPRVVKVWDWERRRLVKTLEKAEGAQHQFTQHEVLYSDDGRLLVSCDRSGVDDEFIRFWSTQDWAIAKSLYDKNIPREGCQDMAFSRKGDEFYYVENHGWNPAELVSTSTKTGDQNWTLKIPKLKLGAFAIDPTGELIAIVGSNLELLPPPILDNKLATKSTSLILVDAARRVIVKTINVKMSGMESYQSIAWSPDGKRLAISGSGYLQIFKDDGSFLEDYHWDGVASSRVVYSPNRNYMFESDFNGRGTGMGILIWDYYHKTLLQRIPGDIACLSISKDSKYLAVGGLSEVSVWRLN